MRRLATPMLHGVSLGTHALSVLAYDISGNAGMRTIRVRGVSARAARAGRRRYR